MQLSYIPDLVYFCISLIYIQINFQKKKNLEVSTCISFFALKHSRYTPNNKWQRNRKQQEATNTAKTNKQTNEQTAKATYI